MRLRLLGIACVVAALGFSEAAGPSPSLAYFVPQLNIVSPPGGAPAADGPSDNTAFSQDNRDVHYLAYDSAADNLVSGDTNAHRDVFLLAKDGSVGGRLSRVSISSRGRQANGDSTKPALDGTSGEEPHCVAFQSTATNLDRRDHSGDSDVYLRDFRRRTTALVSLHASGAVNASIDGRCRRVVFEARGVVYDRVLATKQTLRVGAGTHPDQQTDGRGVGYQEGGQIWYQKLRLRRGKLALRSRPRLVSTAASGGPANGVSENPSLDDHGRFLAFDSTATNLCTLTRCGWTYHPSPNWRKLDPGAVPEGQDANGPVSDVFRADLRPPPRDGPPMLLVSYDAEYNQLEGPSVDPQISRAGQGIVFTSGPTTANGLTMASASQNVFGWSGANKPAADGHLHVFSEKRCEFPCGALRFNGPSMNPSMSSRGNFVAFTSTEAGLAGERNGAGIADVFLEFTSGPPRVP